MTKEAQNVRARCSFWVEHFSGFGSLSWYNGISKRRRYYIMVDWPWRGLVQGMKRSFVHKVILPMMVGNYPSSSQTPNFVFCLHVDGILFSDFSIYFYVVQCIRCQWQTSSFASPVSTNPPIQNDWERWWVSRWANACPMCEGRSVRVV